MTVTLSPLYRRRPVKAARRLAWLETQSRLAKERGDERDAQSFDTARAEMEALMRSIGACRRCGRPLTDPDSIAAGIGPQCVKKVEVGR